MADTNQVILSDEHVTSVLGTYAGLVHHVLDDPGRWLGLDDDPPPTASLPAKAVDAIRDKAFGEVTPANPDWDQRPVKERVEWWIRRIGISAGLAAAAPRLAGALASRIPLQDALGASASGLAVCATAREHGVTEAKAWVPLLAKVLLDRDLPPREVDVPEGAEAEQELDEPGPDAEQKPEDRDDEDDEDDEKVSLGRGARRAAGTIWRLAREIWQLQSVLDERPRGNFLFRAAANIPVVGIVGGWLDERGGIRRASKQTAKLLK